MSEYMFGLGRGHLAARVARAARREGAYLTNYTDPGCGCGYGCRGGDCPANRRHWFSAENRGEPFDRELGARVLAAVRAVAIKRDRELIAAE